jgi:hypothetical protein
MEKKDYKKELSHLYRAPAQKVVVVEVPPMNFLMIDGEGDPNAVPAFGEAMATLFAVSYALKSIIKKSPEAIDYGVMPAEGLWWSDDMNRFDADNKDAWKWTLMVMQPEIITEERVAEACVQVEKKKGLPALRKMRFERFSEGVSAQIMHVGPFSDEGPTVDTLHKHIALEGFWPGGKHHEIYLSDIQRAAPEKWKTIIRQPIQKG